MFSVGEKNEGRKAALAVLSFGGSALRAGVRAPGTHWNTKGLFQSNTLFTGNSEAAVAAPASAAAAIERYCYLHSGSRAASAA